MERTILKLVLNGQYRGEWRQALEAVARFSHSLAEGPYSLWLDGDGFSAQLSAEKRALFVYQGRRLVASFPVNAIWDAFSLARYYAR